MTGSRARAHLGAPPVPSRLAAFPARTIRAGAQVFRCHRTERAPWWFASDGKGRFDLTSPFGSCCLAESPVVALLEAWAGMHVIPTYLAQERAVTHLELPVDLKVADATDNRATAHGITAELFTTIDYQATQLWALALHAAGFGGIRYWARHELAHRHACLAVFGFAGVADWPGPVSGEVVNLLDQPDLLAELEGVAGTVVLPVPPD